MAYTNLYDAIAGGALGVAVGSITGGSASLEELQQRLAEPPYGFNLSYDEVRYLAAIAARANVSMDRLTQGGQVWKQDVPVLNLQPFENIEGGDPGVYNYRVVVRYYSGGKPITVPVSFSADHILDPDELLGAIDQYIQEGKVDKYKKPGTEIDIEEAEIVPVFMFRTSWR